MKSPKSAERLDVEEILRRLAIARKLLPDAVARLPEDENWQFVAALLVNDEKIFARVENLVSGKKAGREKKDIDGDKYSAEQLISLADVFDKYAEKERQDAARTNRTKLSQIQIIQRFLSKPPIDTGWLQKNGEAISDKSVEKLIQRGRGMRKWPRVSVKGRLRRLPPKQARAINLLCRFPLDSAEATDAAIDEILSLSFDRDGDQEEIKRLFALYTLRAHAIENLLGSAQLSLLRPLTKEIGEE